MAALKKNSVRVIEDSNSFFLKQKRASKLDVNFVNPFIDGTIHVLKVQVQIEATVGKPYLKTNLTPSPITDIAGIIGITSQTFNGGIAICFAEDVFLKIMSKMLGETYVEINKDLEDGAAEILNMIFGHAKTHLNNNGHSFEKALPTVVRGENLSVNHSNIQASIVLPFETECGPFHMEISTHQF